MPVTVAVWILLASLAAFALMGYDKSCARRGAWRVPEKLLFLSAAAGGSIGVFAGMRLFRHKTKHKSFTLGIPAVMIVQAVLLLVIF